MSFKHLSKPHKPNLRWDKIKLLIFDCDGVLTDGRIIYDGAGIETKFFDAHDGMGLFLLAHTDMKTAVITGRSSAALQRRCEDLKIDYLYQGIANKLQKVKELLGELNLDFGNVLYMGDDWNDMNVMFKSAISVCPGDAMTEVKELADKVMTRQGGRGAVRECIDMVLAHKGIHEQTVMAYLNQIG